MLSVASWHVPFSLSIIFTLKLWSIYIEIIFMRCWYVNEFCAWHTKSTICSNSHASYCDLLTIYYYLELNSFFLFNISKLSRWSQNGKPFLMYPFQYLFLVYKGISLVLFQKSCLLCLYQKYELSHSRHVDHKQVWKASPTNYKFFQIPTQIFDGWLTIVPISHFNLFINFHVFEKHDRAIEILKLKE